MKTRVVPKVCLALAALLAGGAIQVAATSGSAHAMLEHNYVGHNFMQATGTASTSGKIIGVAKIIVQPAKAAKVRKTGVNSFSFMTGPLKITNARDAGPGLIFDFDAASLFPVAANWEANVVSATGDLMSCDMAAATLCVPSEVTDKASALRERRFGKRSGSSWAAYVRNIALDKQTMMLLGLVLLVLIQVFLRDDPPRRYGRSGRRRRSRRRRRTGSATA